MNFAFPHALGIAAAAIPISIILFLWKSRWTHRQLSGVVAHRLREQLTGSIDWWKRRVKAVLFVLALIFLLIAIGRPQWGYQNAEIDRNNVDFIVALDLSRSMLAEDMAGQPRLKAAMDAIDTLINRLDREDRIGLIGFAGEPFVAAPITQDHETVRQRLQAMEPGIVARPGSNLALTIRLAERSFAIGHHETKALVLITDGEQLQGDAVIAARDAARNGIRIFTIGVGSADGVRIPERKENGAVQYVKNEFGTEVISRLNKHVLQQVAANGHGDYEALGAEARGLLKIYERGLQPMGKARHEKPTREPAEYFQLPLALAVALFLIEMLVNERRKVVRARTG